MNKTKIEWVKNPDGTPGYTWNPITGCLNNCSYCYARKLANTRLKERYLANTNISPETMFVDVLSACEDPFYPRFWEDRLYDIPSGKPKGIFVCDMSDLFGIGIPEEWTYRVITQMRGYPRHRFYLLTKQPQNLRKFSPFPDNCWVGVSATSLHNFDMATNAFRQIEAKVKYLSIEPLLYEPIWTITNDLHLIDWVIIGSQTKPYKPPEISWVQEIALACTKAHIPLFLKDNLKSLLPNRMPFWAVYSWKELDKGALITMSENRYRQEIPNV